VLKEKLHRYYADSFEECRRSVLDNLPDADGSTLLDCGCADGSLTVRFAKRARATRVLGVEVFEKIAAEARERGIEIASSDLNGPLDVADGSIDVVTANQVIEHLYNTDGFMRELHRVLRPGGTLVLSTNNLASWHNVVALVLGAQPFPADVSSNPDIGKLVRVNGGDTGRWSSWTHLRIFSHKALKEMMEAHGFIVEKVQGVGYYPLPSGAAKKAAALDPRHAAYLTLRCRKRVEEVVA
jgi:ubiquinone/menaquinone biosynthesis C-methylase UbiE